MTSRRGVPYEPPIDDILVALDALGIDDPAAGDVLRAFGKLAADVIAPSDVVSDVVGATHRCDGSVSVPAEVAAAHAAFVDGGWSAAPHPVAIGGGGLGPVLSIALQEMYASANLALSLSSILTDGAVRLLARWGTEEQQATYLPPLVAGDWTGTMDLTEADAGSDLGAIRTRAVQAPDGSWRITGTKVFITWGEHDLSENIVHLVLARTPGSPAGTRGISLFVVPKVLPAGSRNKVRCAALERKLGIHGSPTCVMQFEDAWGELVGPEHAGVPAMFTMMNAARLAIAVQGLAVGERAWRQAHHFALERQQGRASSTAPGARACIAEHPDVRRMLADLRSTTRAMRLLLYVTASRNDAGVLTPVSKAWCTDNGFRLASEALQVHGGAGFVEDTGIAQRLRDARIGPIYEGTNGIQAIDLVLRKVVDDGGAALGLHLDDLWLDSTACSTIAGMAEVRALIADGISAVRRCTDWMVEAAARDRDDALAGATLYLDLLGTVTAGAYLAQAAAHTHQRGLPSADELVADARYFALHKIRAALGLVGPITSGIDAVPAFR